MMRIEATGLRATIQDRGRFGHLREGIPPLVPPTPPRSPPRKHSLATTTAMLPDRDRRRSVRVSVQDRRIVAVTGREVSPARTRCRAGLDRGVRAARRHVHRCLRERSRFVYLAVSGGIATEPILGSRAAYLPAGIGRPLRTGEVLPLGTGRVDMDRAGHSAVSPDYDTGQIRAITGPHAQRFTDEAIPCSFKLNSGSNPRATAWARA